MYSRHHWHLNHGLKFENSFYKGCYDLTMLCLNTIDIRIIAVEGIGYRCIIHDIRKFEGINLLENSVLVIHSST